MISEVLGVGRKSMNTKTNHMSIPGKKYIANIVKSKDCQEFSGVYKHTTNVVVCI